MHFSANIKQYFNFFEQKLFGIAAVLVAGSTVAMTTSECDKHVGLNGHNRKCM